MLITPKHRIVLARLAMKGDMRKISAEDSRTARRGPLLPGPAEVVAISAGEPRYGWQSSDWLRRPAFLSRAVAH